MRIVKSSHRRALIARREFVGGDVAKLEQRGIRGFCELVRSNSAALLRVKGFDEGKVADLIDRMTRAGYFEDN